MTKLIFEVSLEQPADCTVAEIREYIEEAVATFKGCKRPPFAYGEGDPGDPIFELNSDSVKVKRITSRYKPPSA